MTAVDARADLADTLNAGGTISDDDADRWLLQVTGPQCPHEPRCPAADAVDHDAARVVAYDFHLGYALRCNGVISFEDTGDLIPDDSPTHCHAEQPHRGPAPHSKQGEQS